MTRKVLIMTLAVGLALGGIIMGAQVKTTSSPPDTQLQAPTDLKLPDLIVEEIKFTIESSGSGGTNVRIWYAIGNHSDFPSRCCPTEEGKKAWKNKPVENFLFHVSLEERDYPNGKYHMIAMVSTELTSHQNQVLNQLVVVPSGKQRQFRVKVDPENWIREKNDANNEKEARWPIQAIQPPIK